MLNDLAVSGVYIAAIIGAGFASGNEIMHYFARYGKNGFFGIIIASFLFGFLGYVFLSYSGRKRTDNYKEFLSEIFPKPISDFFNIITCIFIFFIFSAMISGGGEALSELCNIRKIWGTMFILTAAAVVLIFDMKGLVAVNGIMSVLIIAGIVGVCVYIFTFREASVFKNFTAPAISGAVYTGYNILTAGAVMPPLSKCCVNPKRVGILSGLCIFLMITLIWGLISIYYGKTALGAMPMLTLCKRHGSVLSIIYSIILFMAMYTTAVANGFTLIAEGKGNKRIKIALLITSAFFMSSISFDAYVGIIYKNAGYISVLMMFVIIIKFFQKK